MLVSVIITTKNEEKNIKNCLDSIAKQFFSEREIEIIVVDNGSTDKTKEIAQKYIKCVFDQGPERSAQRNFGVKKSIGKYILYLDADMTLSPGVIRECVNQLDNNNEIAALYIPEIIIGDNFWNKVRRFERNFYDATAIDSVRFIRKDIFLKAGGFDESLTGPEDWDLDKRIRKIGNIGIIKSQLYHNEGKFNLRNYIKKKMYYAEDFEKYIAKWSKEDTDIKKQLGFWYRYFGVFLEKGKWKKFISRPDLVLGMYWLRGMVGIKYLIKIYYK